MKYASKATTACKNT